MKNNRIHFIAIGGSAMHNLAIALHQKGYAVTGSDDEIFEPALSRLSALGLLPSQIGWFPEKIDDKIDAIILGMHARAGNPELLKARELGLKIYSYPEFLYEQSKDKLRIVIGGSHGKTTITAMVLHAMQSAGIDCDFMVGAKLEGFDVMVRLSHEARIMVIEGDEYLTSALDPRPKFHVYQPDIALVSGIAWDHMNVFPTFENYVEQFRIFMQMVPADGAIVYCAEDHTVERVVAGIDGAMKKLPYRVPDYEIIDGKTFLNTSFGQVPLMVFGKHNLMNIEGARLVCDQAGLADEAFYNAISTFKGAANRLELMYRDQHFALYRDFAHAPSKLKATVQAVREQYPGHKLVACFELHTYSSLNKDFLDQYAGSMDSASEAIVYFSPHALEIKKLPMLSAADIAKSFQKADLKVFSEKEILLQHLSNEDMRDTVLLMMSSGNYDGVDMQSLASAISRNNAAKML